MGTHMNLRQTGQVYDIESVGYAPDKFLPITILIKLNFVFLTFWINFIRNSNKWRIFVKTIVKFLIPHVCEILDLMSDCQFVNNISSRS